MTSLVVGGGVSGLVSAYFLAKSGHAVTLIERNFECGGLLRSFDYGEFGRFDYGAHNILELGIAELDDLFWSLLPEEDWQVTMTKGGQTRALTGLIYRQQLQKGSPFIDLRSHPKWSEYVAALFTHLNHTDDALLEWHDLTAQQYAECLFGAKITNEIIGPALQQLHKKPAYQLNAMVLFLTQFTRLVMFDEPLMQDLLATKSIAKRLSYPDQLNLPDSILNLRRSLYPRDYGIYRVIDALVKKCKAIGVDFLLGSEITDLKVLDSTVRNVRVESSEGVRIFDQPDVIFWTAGLMSLSKTLGLLGSEQWDAPASTVMSHFLLSKPLNAGELSFIYNYDFGSKIFRIDNYSQYCERAPRANGYPITVESLLYTPFEASRLRMDILQEMQSVGLLDGGTDVLFETTEQLQYGFPMLSQRNVQQMNRLRDSIDKCNVQNLQTLGILAKPGLFFESDVMVDTMKALKKWR